MTIQAAFFGALFTLVFTGVVANWLVQRWQYNNWINQQRFLGSEKRYEALKTHADEISRLSASRLAAMFRLLAVMDQADKSLETRLQIYSDAMDEWNKHINEIYFKTTLLIDFNMTKRLEGDVNEKFVSIGAQLENMTRRRRLGQEIIPAEKDAVRKRLFSLQGILGNINRDILREVLSRHASTYHGTKLNYSRQNLEYFSNWQLFKALFISNVQQHAITLTSFQLERPAIRNR